MEELDKIIDCVPVEVVETCKCVHCGEDTRVDDVDHWQTCPKHPAGAVVRELEAKVILLEGAAQAGEERLVAAAKRAMTPYVGCDTPDALADKAMSLEKEVRSYYKAFGCLGCGEVHNHDGCCPPSEVRTSGTAWFSTTQAINRFKAMEREIEYHECLVQELREKAALAGLPERNASHALIDIPREMLGSILALRAAIKRIHAHVKSPYPGDAVRAILKITEGIV